MAENQLYEKIMGLAGQNIAEPLSTLYNFLQNKEELKSAKNGTRDKEFHAKANCESAQYGGTPTALGLSFGREIWDILRKNTWDKSNMTFGEIWNDSQRDWETDSYGLMQGLLNPLKNCDDILDKEYLRSLNKD